MTAAAQLGQKLRSARRGQGLTLEAVSRRTGLSVRFLSELERGKEGASLGRVLKVAEAVGLELTAQPLEAPRVEIARFPELARLAWQRPGAATLDERDALALYEANWRFVDHQHLVRREAELIAQLARRHGHGVLNV